MRKQLKTENPSLAGGTELVVRAPLRQGMVPSLESVTYRSRTQALLRLLHAGRRGSHEYQLFRAMSDAVERVGAIHSVRVAVLEPQGEVMLSVNFDGPFEAYVRVIWQKASRLLDLIFCNTQNYPLGWRSSHSVWRDWLESVRVDTPFFYALPGQTYQDGQYLAVHERLQRRSPDDLALARLAVPEAEQIAWDLVLTTTEPGGEGPPEDTLSGPRAAIRQGLQSLAGLYRLADLYPPGTADGQVLLDAAHELLPEFARLQHIDAFAEATDKAATRFRDQLAWFRQTNPRPALRVPPPLADAPVLPLANVQGGVLAPFPNVSHGLLCLVALDLPAGGAALIEKALPLLGSGDQVPALHSVVLNIAFTAEGLRACGLDERSLAGLPHEFRQGMANRCGLLGDLRHNHPRRWTLPPLNGEAGLDPAWKATPTTPVVPTELVHVLLQWRWIAAQDPSDTAVADTTTPTRALADAARHLLAGLDGVRLLSVQWMSRVDDQGRRLDHFGFADGQSQPVYDRASAGTIFPNQVAPGEVLVGHDNAADHAADLPENRDPARAWLRDGSYLVVRKLGLDTATYRQAVDSAAEANKLDRQLVLGKMMGRWPQGSAYPGHPMVAADPATPNDFDYADDALGQGCPFAAHIRLANPRRSVSTEADDAGSLTETPGGRPPRMVRTGLPFGPKAPDWPSPGSGGPLDDGQDRGLVFMAYNASIAEQFEVVQRWLSGGNSTGIASAHADPFTAVPRQGHARMFRFEHQGKVVRMPLDGSAAVDAPVRSITRLQWGLYLFAPARSGLQWLAQQARQASPTAPPVPWDAADGARTIRQLLQLEQDAGAERAALAWKAALEDPEAVADWRSASVWAAIRQFHGGALRTPYGVLVASETLVNEVLRNAHGHVTVDGYQQRLRDSIGEIYLGLDDGSAYQQQSAACNRAIMALDFDHGFTPAFEAARDALAAFVQDAQDRAADDRSSRWDLALDARELIDAVLAALCENWFGLSELGGHFVRGGSSWPADGADCGMTPRYPGHFTAASRATFQPAPGDLARRLSRNHGQAVRRAMQAFLAANMATTAPVTRAVLDDVITRAGPGGQPDLDLAGRTIAGALMGFLPTTSGSLRRILAEWLQDGTLAALRASHPAAAGWNVPADARQRMHARLRETMQARPVPELIWRTARRAHVLQDGSEPACSVEAGDTVVLALVSATQQALARGGGDVMPIFGGRRDMPTSPTHACPGYLAAMGVIVGVLAAVAARQDTLRSGAASGVLYFDGPMPAAAPGDPAAAGGTSRSTTVQTETLKTFSAALKLPLTGTADPVAALFAPGTKGRLLGWGDSWINNPLAQGRNLHDALEAMGYDTSGMGTPFSFGTLLSSMAKENPKAPFPGPIWRHIRQALLAASDPVQPRPLPLAVIVSGGGNDVHREDGNGRIPLFEMLNPKAVGTPFFNGQKDQFIQGRLAGDLRAALGLLVGATKGAIPVLVTGYDHPIPDGRPALSIKKAPLQPPISARGYSVAEGRQIMEALITELNGQIATVVGEFSQSNVHAANLTGTLTSPDHTLDWGDELHPTVAGFAALAAKLVTFIPPPPAPTPAPTS
ncbi:hypothetical protein [Pseudaquabacterium pictum]|uniref:SGNH hydrolase-type esterase domain-containing protein n=1 Tax=Pseudaquabacterium pictum TaxID=2315236 RepID=A0A480ALX3_9BURK|nr:hypothetical protein [Rubrivivax pictus]GCL60982.1 hypothetical protein AQPW35_00630 [Rubrivivax pictus]